MKQHRKALLSGTDSHSNTAVHSEVLRPLYSAHLRNMAHAHWGLSTGSGAQERATISKHGVDHSPIHAF